MKEMMIWGILTLAASLFAAEECVWQLGKEDGASDDFGISYRAWEYGNAPAVRKSPQMDHETHTFQYRIDENRVIPRPQIVNGLTTESVLEWMPSNEIVSGLKLTWKEAEAGNRRLVLALTEWRNLENGNDNQVRVIHKEGIEIELPDGSKRIFYLPPSRKTSAESLKFSPVFSVKTGENSLIIRIRSKAKLYQFSFDSIALTKTDSVSDARPILECSFDSGNGIYQYGGNGRLSFLARNLPGGQGELSYTIEDAFGKQAASGRLKLKESGAELALPTATRGWFLVQARLGDAAVASSFVVLEAVTPEYVDSSRFGCHALMGDGYRPIYSAEEQESRLRMAFLAGAKWARYHRLAWNIIEPEKGKYFWDFVDRKLALAQKYRMRPLLDLGNIPQWASSNPEEKGLTVCGDFRYTQYPPRDFADWGNFLTTLVSRYKDQVKWYELWNEPGFTSAFWCNGSPGDFGLLLKTGYEAAKKADPSCVILSGAPLNSNRNFFEQAVKSTGGKLYFDVMSLHYLQNTVAGGNIFAGWKTVLDKLGGPKIPFVNSEEMVRQEGATLLGGAGQLIRLYVREASLGIEKTFAFDFFRAGSGHNASAFDYSGNPLPQYAAYRTMTHRLEYADYVADLSTASCEAYLFDRKGVPVIVAWSDAVGEAALPSGPGRVKLINLMDVESVPEADAGKIILKNAGAPQFIEGGDLAFWKAYAAWCGAWPRKLSVKPGATQQRALNLAAVQQLAEVKLVLPDSWSGGFENGKLRIGVPRGVYEGRYDVTVAAVIAGCPVSFSFPVDVDSGVIGANLLVNGDFKQKTDHWFFPADKNRWNIAEGAGVNGGNALRTKGKTFFGYVKGIKVRPGEKYMVLSVAKGAGRFGGVYSLLDRNGKQVFPKNAGVNCLRGELGNTWKTYSDVITIDAPDAVLLKLGVLADYGEKNGNDIFFDRFAVLRLTDTFTQSKALYQGVCARVRNRPSAAEWEKIPAMTVDSGDCVVDPAGIGWRGGDDLSASCQLAMDAHSLFLRFAVRDDIGRPTAAGEEGEGWKYDSIQFAVDPAVEGKDRTEILIAEDGSGKAFACKYNNFWTPELMDNLTRRGLMPDVKIEVKKSAGSVVYLVEVPLRELYPLPEKAEGFGFSWLVNDSDGGARKYIHWSDGIGGAKDAAKFGMVKCTTENRVGSPERN